MSIQSTERENALHGMGGAFGARAEGLSFAPLRAFMRDRGLTATMLLSVSLHLVFVLAVYAFFAETPCPGGAGGSVVFIDVSGAGAGMGAPGGGLMGADGHNDREGRPAGSRALKPAVAVRSPDGPSVHAGEGARTLKAAAVPEPVKNEVTLRDAAAPQAAVLHKVNKGLREPLERSAGAAARAPMGKDLGTADTPDTPDTSDMSDTAEMAGTSDMSDAPGALHAARAEGADKSAALKEAAENTEPPATSAALVQPVQPASDTSLSSDKPSDDGMPAVMPAQPHVLAGVSEEGVFAAGPSGRGAGRGAEGPEAGRGAAGGPAGRTGSVAGGAGGGGGVIVSGLRAPEYPLLARLRGEEGRVEIKVSVGPGGRLLDVSVLGTSGFAALDRAAVKAVREARFAAPSDWPLRTPAEKTIVFVFRLEDRDGY